MQPTRRPRRGEELELAIESLSPRGEGVGRLGTDAVRVRGALPGARVRVRVLRRRRGALDARLLTVLTPPPDAEPPACSHVASCGGCTLQGLTYAAQLSVLEHLLRGILAPLLERAPCAVSPLAGAEESFGYRNKMDFTFGNRRFVEPHEPPDSPADFALGLHARGLFHKVLDVDRCHIAFPQASGILAAARDLALERGLTPWDPRAHTGLLRHLVLRRSWASGEILANLVTSDDAPEVVAPYVGALVERCPEITTLVQNVNTRPAQVAVGEREHLHLGRGWIEESLGGLTFRVSANSFFQTNTLQAERLAQRVRRRAAAREGDVVYDLCSGAGTLGLVIAATPGVPVSVLGFELVPEAVADARWNAERNGLDRVRFVEGDLRHTLRSGDFPAPDVCLADPPRAGLHPRVLVELLRLSPRRVVYVSCNPTAAVRDLEPLVDAGYGLEAVEPLDLFPHTPHLECVFTLERGA